MATTTGTTESALARIVNQAKEARFLASLVFPFDPVPASRPKVSRWGVYYGKTYKTWRELAEAHINPGDLSLEPTTPLLVVIFTVSKRAKTSKLVFPRGDTDNFAKGPLDVITKATGWWHDDNQIVTLLSAKRFATAGEEPHTLVEIYRLP